MRSVYSLALAVLASTLAPDPCVASAVSQRGPFDDLKYNVFPTLKEQDTFGKSWVERRYELVPKILEKYGYDAYILSMREYAEDTIFKSFVSSVTTFAARRRTFYLFHTKPPTKDLPNPVIWVDNRAEMWDGVKDVLEELDPKKIAINIDSDYAFSDGLHSGERETLLHSLGPRWADRMSSERMIAVEVVATRVGGGEQLEWYKKMMENVWKMVDEGFSNQVITPGETTAEDVEWWFRDKMHAMNASTWFPPSVTAYRASGPVPHSSPIQPGDLLHTDIGITLLNMNTDTQHLGYILRSGETSVPDGLKKGLRNANRMQELTRTTITPGETGDEILRDVKAQMVNEGLNGTIYSHPIGDFGHSAGPLIGMTNLQESVPGGGQIPCLKNMWFSVELSGETFVPEWNRTQSFQLEEDVYWSEDRQAFEWVFGQQKNFHLVRPKEKARCGSLTAVIGNALVAGLGAFRWR